MDAKGRTNHYLFYAQTLIKEISSPDREKSKPYIHAIEMSVCLQLKQCWHAWLMELGQLIKVDLDANDFFGCLKEEENTQLGASFPPELQLIEDRLQDAGWVSSLKALFEDPIGWIDGQRSQLPEKDRVKDELSISAIDLNALAAEPIESVLLNVLTDLKEYISSVREQQTEW